RPAACSNYSWATRWHRARNSWSRAPMRSTPPRSTRKTRPSDKLFEPAGVHIVYKTADSHMLADEGMRTDLVHIVTNGRVLVGDHAQGQPGGIGAGVLRNFTVHFGFGGASHRATRVLDKQYSIHIQFGDR